MDASRIKNVALLIISAALFGFLAVRWWPQEARGAKARRSVAEEMAAVVIREAGTLSPGSSVLVIAPTNSPGDPYPRHLAERIESGLRQTKIGTVVVRELPYSELIELEGDAVDKTAFLALLREHGDCDLVISLVGVPRLLSGDLAATPSRRIIVVTSTAMPYLDNLPGGLLEAAIVPRHGRTDVPPDPALGTLNESFVLYRYRK
jgi:hypothetical protein